jgi:uncharacterized protein (TIGR03643 family)
MTTQKLKKFISILSDEDTTHIILAALADDIPFESIKLEYGLTENEIIQLMKKNLPIKKFILWRKRARGSGLKHLKQSRIKKKLSKNNI